MPKANTTRTHGRSQMGRLYRAAKRGIDLHGTRTRSYYWAGKPSLVYPAVWTNASGITLRVRHDAYGNRIHWGVSK